MTRIASAFYWILLTSSIFAAPGTDTLYRSNVDFKKTKSQSLGSDVASVIDRFEQTLNGVNRPQDLVSSYGGRSSVGNRGSNSGFPDVDDSAHTQQFSSTLSALLRILDRLQNIDTTTDAVNNVPSNSEQNVDISGNSVNSPIAFPEANLLSNTFTDPVNESQSVAIGVQHVMSTVEPFITNVTLSVLDHVAQELQNVSLNEFNVSAVIDDQNATLSIPTTNDTELDSSFNSSSTELAEMDDLISNNNLIANDTDILELKTANETLDNIAVVGEQSDGNTDDYMDEPDIINDNMEERFAAFVPSPQLLRQVTNPPVEYSPGYDGEDLDVIAESVVDQNRTEVEVTTISAEEFLSTKPFLENFVNSSTISEIDLSTVASIALSQSSVATLSSLSEDHPSFIANRPMRKCMFNKVEYVSGQNIDQVDPCRFCVCINGEIICYRKNCPALDGCSDLSFEGVCPRSLYLCPIPVKGQPLPFADNSIKTAAQRDLSSTSNTTQLKCNILGVEYGIGDIVGVASGVCMECRCALDSLYCSPKCCFQPLTEERTLDSLTDPIKASRADDPVWLPMLANPLSHLKSDFENQQ